MAHQRLGFGELLADIMCVI